MKKLRLVTLAAAMAAGVATTSTVTAQAQPKLAQAIVISTGPESHFVPVSSYRAYDSRTDTIQGKIFASQAGDVGRNQRPVYAPYFEQDGAPLIPLDAVAVTYNVQAIQTEGSGYMHVDGFGSADGSASTLVWDRTGERVANSGVALLTSAFDDPGALGVYVNGSADAASHVIIDITGYYVTATP